MIKRTTKQTVNKTRSKKRLSKEEQAVEKLKKYVEQKKKNEEKNRTYLWRKKLQTSLSSQYQGYPCFVKKKGKNKNEKKYKRVHSPSKPSKPSKPFYNTRSEIVKSSHECLMCDRSAVPGTGLCYDHLEHESD